MATDAKQVAALTREVRACFNRLRTLGDQLHRDVGVTAAMRAVMESLFEGGEQTVPAIARVKGVTRQHIQVLVNELVSGGLAAVRQNPSDRRSPLVALTKKGHGLFERMREREKTVLVQIARALKARDVGAAAATLEALHGWLDSTLTKGEAND